MADGSIPKVREKQINRYSVKAYDNKIIQICDNLKSVLLLVDISSKVVNQKPHMQQEEGRKNKSNGAVNRFFLTSM